MSQRSTPVTRATSYLLIYLTAVYPLHPAIAAGITPDNHHTQVQHQGNVPVVNIATPNSAGISHNTYQEFNVATQGTVLNNATQTAQSQLAGQLNANPNLQGNAAELIINEVTGNGRSELQGQLEIVGNKANVIIANPNGITCDGCGFINTASATLTTGKPQFDKQGALEALEVKQGLITLGGKGLDGKATDYVDIISRATELNGKIQANNLSLTQGTNRISLKDSTVKSIAGEGAKPQLAIDTKALGGMYANKIRLVATEDGVGVNLKDVVSDQRDITLNANGKIELGNTHAKTDLNIMGKETYIAPNINVQAGQDISLANTTLENNGSVTAGRDMRVFGDTVRNTGDKALLQANDNLWIQKDAQGNKGQLVENRSATIKTVKGDLVVRTKELNNTRNIFVINNKQITPDFTDRDMTVLSDVSIFGEPYTITAELTPLPDKWFGPVYFSRLGFEDNGTEKAYLNNTRMKSRVLENSLPGLILSGRNTYINSDNLSNQISKIEAGKDIFLTGNKLINESQRKSSLNHFIIYDLKLEPVPTVYPYKKSGETQTWNDEDDVIEPASIIAKGSLVADFKDSININTALPDDIKTVSEVNVKERPETVSAKNITLHAGQINITDKIKAISELNIIAEKEINLHDAALLSSNNLSMTAINHINALQSEVKGKDITLISRHGDVRFQSSDKPGYFNADNTRRISILSANGSLTIQAGKNLLLQNTCLTPSTDISLTANNDIEIENTVRLSPRQTGPMPPDKWDPDLLNAILPEQEQGNLHFLLPMTGVLHASTSLMIHAGGDFVAQGAFISAGKDVYLSAAKHIELGSRALVFRKLEGIFLSGNYIPPSRSLESGSRITAKNNISLISGGDINGKAVQIQANSNTLLSAGRNITFPSLAYSVINQANDNNKDDRHIIAQIRGDKKLTIAANGALTTAGAKLTSGGDVTLSSGGNMRFESVQNHTSRESGREFTGSVTQQGTELTSGGVLTVISNGSILFQATQLAAKGAMDIAAQGGYLYAQAMEESSHYEKTETKRRWYGKKKTTTRTRHDVTNKVTEFTAGGDINLLSRDDSTYEASKITTHQNAKLTSTHGQVNFKAVNNSTFAQTITHSKGFYIKQTDKGYTENTWVLPAIHLGGKLTVETANGISADIKAKNGQSLQNAVSVFGNTPETAWLKGLNERQDVQWNLVKDAYDSWDYKSQHLNPVVSAVIAIAVATVTAGAGITASVAGSAAGTAGSAATAAGATVGSMAYGATASGMAALASQAAVALVDNQGDLSKTLKAMGSSDTVKSTLTSMAMGGALAGFDNVMGWDNAANGTKLDPSKAKLPSLSNGDWSKVAQRVAGQSIIGASLGTTINGGSFKDNFTTALLSNIGSQINAEGANLIGNNGQVLGVPGKTISHAAVSALAAEIGGGNAKGAAAGALAAELAAITLDKTFSDPMNIQAGGKIIGGVAGAIATNSAEGANSGANAGGIVIVYNSLAHFLSASEKERRGTIKAYEEKKRAFCQHSPEACKQAGGIISVGTDFVPVVGDIKSFVEAQSAIDYLAAAVGIIPGIGDAASKSIKTAEKALAKGDISEASRLINKASDEISSVKVLDVGSYKELKAREIVGDELEHDHIPSYSALRTAKEKELGRKLTPEEDKALYKNSTAVEVPKDVHAAGPTYRGKNTREQVNQDAMDLCGATCRDTDALRNNMLERGYDPKQVDDAIKQIKERNRQMGVIK
ncbi:filamentous hemagglutinin N-terminal domain-containing protein [Photorhabdus khanii]|uniref:Filamentous hemagglutinin N-terminal domain-containing protein n=1 Tax=Photorhabdus khanii TaxID=1004150 RepID=A0A7C9KW57_9GAMM|nr:DUF637 domain-containing protein [Photorhabdus khanii]MQL50687.1 filamentous hemagglutinin N-terminal domain-containing protein [Photorhabdus khanii]